MSQDKKEEDPKKVVEESKKEEKEKPKPADPLDGKSVDELKEMIKELQKNQSENTRKVRAFALSLQTVSFKLKELGIDMGTLGRNVDQTIDAIMNNKLPQNVADQMT